jgi:DNA repair protein RadC
MPSKRQQLKKLTGDWTAARITVKYSLRVMDSTPINTQEAAYEKIISVWDKELINLQEQVIAFYFNRAGRLIGHRLICTGTATQCLMDAKFVVSLALHTMACSVIIAHNHPSGKLEPSDMDMKVTKKIKAALDLIDVKLLNHFIVTEDGYYSFAEQSEL